MLVPQPPQDLASDLAVGALHIALTLGMTGVSDPEG